MVQSRRKVKKFVEGRVFNVGSIKIQTTLYEYFRIILLYGHLVYFNSNVLAWEICNMKWEFAKKVIIKSQRQFMYGSNFCGLDISSNIRQFNNEDFFLPMKPSAPLAPKVPPALHYGCSWSFGSIENFLLSLLSGMFLCQERQETK